MSDNFDYVFPVECRIDNLDNGLQEMKSLSQRRKKKFSIDIREAVDYDLAGIQLMISFFKELIRKKSQIIVKGPLSPAFQEKLEFLDLVKIEGSCTELFFKQLKKGEITYE